MKKPRGQAKTKKSSEKANNKSDKSATNEIKLDEQTVPSFQNVNIEENNPAIIEPQLVQEASLMCRSIERFFSDSSLRFDEKEAQRFEEEEWQRYIECKTWDFSDLRQFNRLITCERLWIEQKFTRIFTIQDLEERFLEMKQNCGRMANIIKRKIAQNSDSTLFAASLNEYNALISELLIPLAFKRTFTAVKCFSDDRSNNILLKLEDSSKETVKELVFLWANCGRTSRREINLDIQKGCIKTIKVVLPEKLNDDSYWIRVDLKNPKKVSYELNPDSDKYHLMGGFEIQIDLSLLPVQNNPKSFVKSLVLNDASEQIMNRMLKRPYNAGHEVFDQLKQIEIEIIIEFSGDNLPTSQNFSILSCTGQANKVEFLKSENFSYDRDQKTVKVKRKWASENSGILLVEKVEDRQLIKLLKIYRKDSGVIFVVMKLHKGNEIIVIIDENGFKVLKDRDETSGQYFKTFEELRDYLHMSQHLYFLCDGIGGGEGKLESSAGKLKHLLLLQSIIHCISILNLEIEIDNPDTINIGKNMHFESEIESKPTSIDAKPTFFRSRIQHNEESKESNDWRNIAPTWNEEYQCFNYHVVEKSEELNLSVEYCSKKDNKYYKSITDIFTMDCRIENDKNISDNDPLIYSRLYQLLSVINLKILD
ncbi:MAG: hypothetical protein MHMPM18_000630 [Marteilia pararefringens]